MPPWPAAATRSWRSASRAGVCATRAATIGPEGEGNRAMAVGVTQTASRRGDATSAATRAARASADRSPRNTRVRWEVAGSVQCGAAEPARASRARAPRADGTGAGTLRAANTRRWRASPSGEFAALAVGDIGVQLAAVGFDGGAAGVENAPVAAHQHEGPLRP